MDPDVDPQAPTRPGIPAPSMLGGFRLVRELGRGGMGVVYLAHDDQLQRDVALKVLQPELAKDAEFEQRFIREARTAAKLDHPNVVPVYTAGRDGDVLYMAMRFVPGRTLHALMKERGRLPVREALEFARQAARGLGAAHAASLVHRDVKPHNLMIDESGTVKVMDFGLMRSWQDRESITEPGVFYGTPEYASPEQCTGGEMDGRSDLYSLGAVLYEMLGGRKPHAGNTPMALFQKILEEDPAPLAPEVPAAVEAVVRKLMAKRPEDRYATAAGLESAIDALLAGGAPEGRGSRRVFMASAALLLLAGAGAWWTVSRAGGDPVPEPPAAGSRLRLVVFDLKNGIPKPESAWYSIALSDLLIAGLSKRPGLDVPTRDQLLWTLKQRELEGQAGEEERRVLTGSLGAKVYLSGTYYVQGPRLRLTVAGYRLPDNGLLFPAKSFDGLAEDLLGLADRAAGDLAQALGIEDVAPTLGMLDKAENRDRKYEKREEMKKFSGDPAGDGSRRKLERDEAPKPAAAPPPAPAAPATTAAPARGAEAAAGKEVLREAVPPTGAAPQAGNFARKADVDLKQQMQGNGAGASDWMRGWYENRKAMEGLNLRKADFEELSAAVAKEFAARREGGRREPEAAKAAAQRLAARFEFACPDCSKAFPSLAPCPDCGRVPVVRLRE